MKEKRPAHRLTSYDVYLFSLGRHYEIYKKMGAHLCEEDGKAGTYFAVWAPGAAGVSVVGDFNNWDVSAHPMEVYGDSGIYELFVPDVGKGELYKYVITHKNGHICYKADPYGNLCQVRPDNASVVTSISDYAWTDDPWQKNKKKAVDVNQPMSIYEVHIGSWKKTLDGSNHGFLDYRTLAHQLAEYVRYMGYTHVELIGIAEHPLDGSWGYQVTGYYAPTSRYGTPEDFMYFVDYMHSQGIGVILDWVPAHFPRDEHALGRFDGTPLYEHPDPRRGEHPDWGTYIFNYAKPEVSNFLVANALFWLECFHVDGLRVDAVASMLYLDYGKSDGQWLPNKDGGNENYEAIEFLKHLNSIIHHRVPGAMMIAEESTAWPKVTGQPIDGGLGFTFKWNMGWMNDFLEYMKVDPYFRHYDHHKLTFSFEYMYSEKYILVLSHDEVVHMKGSMMYKAPGDRWQKFANLRTAYGYMYAHPGKKLNFMGNDLAQYSEWSEARSIDWHLLQDEDHRRFHNYMKALYALYRNEPAFWEKDFDPWGFQWIECDDSEHSIVSFARRGYDRKEQVAVVCNFTERPYENFILGVPEDVPYQEIFNSDWEEFGGTNRRNEGLLPNLHQGANRCAYSVSMTLPPLSFVVLKPVFD